MAKPTLKRQGNQNANKTNKETTRTGINLEQIKITKASKA